MDLEFAHSGEPFVTVAGGRVKISAGAPMDVAPAASPRMTLDLAPNPFVTKTLIRYTPPGAGAVDVSVFDLVGRRIARLCRGESTSEPHTLVWSVRNDEGRETAPGLHGVRVRTTNDEVLGKSVLRLR